MTRQFERPAAPQRARANDRAYEDEAEYEPPRREKTKKKGFLAKMFEVEDEDEEFDEEWEQERPKREKPQKQRKKLFDFGDDEEDEDF